LCCCDSAPARDTGPTWAQFLRSQTETIIACDIVIGLLDGSKAYVLAMIEHATHRVRILGATFHPASDWVTQQARNLPMDLEDAGATVKYLAPIPRPGRADASVAGQGDRPRGVPSPAA
jgi:putative transposase